MNEPNRARIEFSRGMVAAQLFSAMAGGIIEQALCPQVECPNFAMGVDGQMVQLAKPLPRPAMPSLVELAKECVHAADVLKDALGITDDEGSPK